MCNLHYLFHKRAAAFVGSFRGAEDVHLIYWCLLVCWCTDTTLYVLTPDILKEKYLPTLSVTHISVAMLLSTLLALAMLLNSIPQLQSEQWTLEQTTKILPKKNCLILTFKATRKQEIYAQRFSYLEAAQYKQLQTFGRWAALLRWGLNVLHECTQILQKIVHEVTNFLTQLFPYWTEMEQVAVQSFYVWASVTSTHYQSAILASENRCWSQIGLSKADE